MTDTVAMDELAAAWEEFQRLGARGRDWPAWSALFTDDAEYIEHCIGRFHGAAGILAFINEAMAPVSPMTFSVDWAILQPPYLAFNIWNHMPDPGDGQHYSFSNLTLLEYAGAGKWKMEEDFYNPRDSGKTVMRWFQAGGTNEMAPDPTIGTISLAPATRYDDPEGVAEMVRDWRAGRPRYTRDGAVWVHGGERTPGHTAAAFDIPADVVMMDGKRAFLRCGTTAVALTHGGESRIRFEERAHNPNEVVPE